MICFWFCIVFFHNQFGFHFKHFAGRHEFASCLCFGWVEHRLDGDEWLLWFQSMHLESMLGFSFTELAKNFHEISLKTIEHFVLRSTVIFPFANHFLKITPHSVALLFFSPWAFCPIRPVADCLNPSFDEKKDEKLGVFTFSNKISRLQTLTTELQWQIKIHTNSGIETVSSGSHWCSEAVRCLFIQSESEQEMHLQPAQLPFGQQKTSLTEGSLSFGCTYW